MNSKKINELENYDITKATENDVIPVVETKDGANEAKKLPVSDLRDIMAKFNITNVVTLVVSLLDALRNAAGEELAAQIERFYAGYAGFMTAIQENEIDFNALAASVVEHSSDEMIEVIYGLMGGGDGGKGEEPTTEEKRQGLIEALTGGDFDIVKGIGSFLGRNNRRISDLESESAGIDGRLKYIENTQLPDISSRLQAIEEAIQQFQNSGNNGGEIYDNSEDVALRNRADALWTQIVGSDASSMTTEDMVAALENGANITPDPNATLAERIEALEALAAQQAQE